MTTENRLTSPRASIQSGSCGEVGDDGVEHGKARARHPQPSVGRGLAKSIARARSSARGRTASHKLVPTETEEAYGAPRRSNRVVLFFAPRFDANVRYNRLLSTSHGAELNHF